MALLFAPGKDAHACRESRSNKAMCASTVNRVEQPAKLVGEGNILTIALERKVLVVEIIGCAERRGPYLEASQLYRSLAEPQPGS